MKSTIAALAALAGSAAAWSGHMRKEDLPELNTANRMGTLRQIKLSQRDAARAAGLYDAGRYRSAAGTPCSGNGTAGEYSCRSVDLAAHLTHEDMGSSEREGNDIWGWTSDDGREFALVGQTDGTAFVEVLDGSLAYLGRLPTQTASSTWRDIKVIAGHAYIGSEASGHGIQVFDLGRLLDVDPSSPVEFSVDGDLAALFDGVGSSHNVVANADTSTLYVVGAAECSGGLVVVDVSDPTAPEQVGCGASDGYVHDAQCVVYPEAGVDEAYRGREVCFAYNEDAFTIYDVSDRASPVVVSSTPYDGASYTHQGWVVDAEFRHVLLDDELDETYGSDQRTRTYIFDISSLEAPVHTGTFVAAHNSIDHNMYVVDGLAYQANYGSGLRILDVAGVAEDPTGGSIEELGYFDCYPEDDADPAAEFYGSWSVYPYFASGTLIVNCIERGLFAVKFTG